nr:hypothetical protein [Tanacetum cinerariifolium]
MTTTEEPRSRIDVTKNKTVIFEANLENSQVCTPKRLKWDEITRNQTWKLEEIIKPKPLKLNKEATSILEHTNRNIVISFGSKIGNKYDKNGTKSEQKRTKSGTKRKAWKKSTAESQQKVKPEKVEADEIKFPRKNEEEGPNCHFPKLKNEGTESDMKCQPKNHDYYDEQNSCYDSNSFGFNQIQPPQYTVNHPIFNAHNNLLDSQNKLMEQMTSMCEMVGQLIQKKQEEKQIQEDQAANARYWKIPAYYDNDDDYNFAITPNEPVDSIIMGDEHLDAISATGSDELIKSSVENLVPNPSESEGENECDLPACFTTFSNILFNAEYEFDSVDDQSLSNEDFLEEIFLNPLFEEEIKSMRIDQHHFNAESNLIESLLNHDSSIIPSSSKIDSLLDEFVGELTLLKSIPPGIDETDCHTENEIRLIERLLYDNSSPRPPEEFVSENSYAEIESFSPSPIPIEDSDYLMEEIDLTFTPDDPMPPGIEKDDDDSRDILIREELLDNYSLPLPENESFYFDIPSSSRPPAKPPDGNT